MHGLINKAVQSFVTYTYGQDLWAQIARDAELGFVDFEAMLIYDDEQTHRVVDAVCNRLDRSRDEVLEDIGTFLVSEPKLEALRRLLRFGGVSYEDFLHSLDDLPDRARLAVDDLSLPALELREHARNLYTLTCHPGLPGFGLVMMGILRAMADDYGALAILEHRGSTDGVENISISLVETEFAEGRSFELGARVG
ncbi:heme NO-binding domain-containing protein [Thalassococcus sp. S3]|uniref:heme NO-binding domain-containing protein n=1 Tax=Thalassococcus sp. S3 TaxID=2017482 RepID=UPI0010243EFC|nr:heme NO-binding domain-containing protein [Thalassococcus sp. S3]QBF31172.1 heme NO-binding protein [Thalassococcus sp. S3]